jgi:hypothetical protein
MRSDQPRPQLCILPVEKLLTSWCPSVAEDEDDSRRLVDVPGDVALEGRPGATVDARGRGPSCGRLAQGRCVLADDADDPRLVLRQLRVGAPVGALGVQLGCAVLDAVLLVTVDAQGTCEHVSARRQPARLNGSGSAPYRCRSIRLRERMALPSDVGHRLHAGGVFPGHESGDRCIPKPGVATGKNLARKVHECGTISMRRRNLT